MHVFYTPDIQTHAELPEEEAILDEDIDEELDEEAEAEENGSYIFTVTAPKSVRLPTNAAW